MAAATQQLSTPDSQHKYGDGDCTAAEWYGTYNAPSQKIAITPNLRFVGI